MIRAYLGTISDPFGYGRTRDEARRDALVHLYKGGFIGPEPHQFSTEQAALDALEFEEYEVVDPISGQVS